MSESKDIEIALSLAEINKILDALGNLPYRDVFKLVGKIQAQAEAQLQPVNNRPSKSELTPMSPLEKTP